MAHFDDLTPHSYTTGQIEADVLNVGWLGSGGSFPTGETTPEFKNALKSLCADPIVSHRGFHACQFCEGGSRETGNGQIRVKDSSGKWYAAPTMIGHYVDLYLMIMPVSITIAGTMGPVKSVNPLQL